LRSINAWAPGLVCHAEPFTALCGLAFLAVDILLEFAPEKRRP
jgi:hypothetical protein